MHRYIIQYVHIIIYAQIYYVHCQQKYIMEWHGANGIKTLFSQED